MKRRAAVLDEPETFEGPWELPEGWVWARLGDIGTWTGGGTPSKAVDAYWQNGSVPWVSPKDMKSPTIRDTEDRITEAAVENSATKFVPPRSVLMVMRSGILRHTFPVAVNEVRVTLNQDLRALTPITGIDPYFIANHLKCLQHKVLTDCAKDGTTVQSVEVSALENVLIALAPEVEQRRIVARIDELFAEIAEGETALNSARQGLDLWRRSLLKAAVTGELTRDWRETHRPSETGADLLARVRVEREATGTKTGRGRRSAAPAPLDTSSLPEMPEGWVWTKLQELITSGPSNGYSPKASKDGTGTLALKLTATTSGRISLATDAIKRLSETINQSSWLFLVPDDLLFQRGNTIEYVGISAVYEGPKFKYIYPDLMIRVTTSDSHLTRWIWRVANSLIGRKYMQSKATGTAGTMPKINGEILRSLPVPLPPHDEMIVILNRVSEALDATDDFDIESLAGLKTVSALRQSILKAAFEGRLVPQDPAEEPASALLTRIRGGGTAEPSPPRRRGRPPARP